MFDEPAAPAPPTPAPEIEKPKTPIHNESDDDDGDHHMDDFGGAPSPGGMSSTGGSRPTTPPPAEQSVSNPSGWEAPVPIMDETPQVRTRRSVIRGTEEYDFLIPFSRYLLYLRLLLLIKQPW